MQSSVLTYSQGHMQARAEQHKHKRNSLPCFLPLVTKATKIWGKIWDRKKAWVVKWPQLNCPHLLTCREHAHHLNVASTSKECALAAECGWWHASAIQSQGITLHLKKMFLELAIFLLEPRRANIRSRQTQPRMRLAQWLIKLLTLIPVLTAGGIAVVPTRLTHSTTVIALSSVARGQYDTTVA